MNLDEWRQELSVELRKFKSAQQGVIELADPFLATSMLQKSLRRADTQNAKYAGVALLRIDPARLWRRIAIVAFEDFGLSNLNLTASVVAAASSKAWRGRNGGDEHVLTLIVECLLGTPRDRRVDEAYMLSVALSRHPNPVATLSRSGASKDLQELLLSALTTVQQCEHSIPFRGIRSVLAGPSDAAIAISSASDEDGAALAEVCSQGRKTSQCLLPVLLPLLKAATLKANAPTSSTISRSAPPAVMIDGMPSYTFDGFTRPGRAALSKLGWHDRKLAKLLSTLHSSSERTTALVNLLFVAEGGVCTTELSDPLYNELKVHSAGCWSGLSGNALSDGIAMMSEAIPALNEFRRLIVARSANSHQMELWNAN